MFGTLRTLLAINVVLLHIFNVPTLGNYSVSFFFILSGFLMTLIMHQTYGYSFLGFKIFWINRILRLYPIYLIILFITIATVFIYPEIVNRHSSIYLPTSIMEWVANLTMLFPEIVPHRFNPRLVPTAWALTNELIFYLLISFGISKTKRRTLIWLLISISYYCATYIFYDIPTYRYSAIFASSLPFAIGAAIFWVINSYPLKKVYPWSIFLLYLLFVLNANYVSIYTSFFREVAIYLNMLLAAMLIYFLFQMKVSEKSKKIDEVIGMYSYPIYLSHYLVAVFYVAFINYGVRPNNFKMDFTALPMYGLILIGFCGLIVYFIDMKVNKLKTKIKKSIKK